MDEGAHRGCRVRGPTPGLCDAPSERRSENPNSGGKFTVFDGDGLCGEPGPSAPSGDIRPWKSALSDSSRSRLISWLAEKRGILGAPRMGAELAQDSRIDRDVAWSPTRELGAGNHATRKRVGGIRLTQPTGQDGYPEPGLLRSD